MQVFRLGLAVVVTLVWLIGYGLSFYKGTPKPEGLDVLMGIVLTWAFGGATFDALRRIRIERAPGPDDRKEPHDGTAGDDPA